MKSEKTKKRKIIYGLVLAISVCLLAAATVLTVYFVTNGNTEHTIDVPDNPDKPDNPDTPDEPDNPDDPDKPTGGDSVVTYASPVAYSAASVYHEIYYNQTTGWYYRHNAVDFAAEEGASVCAIADGSISEISLNDKTGNYIVIDHGNGLKSLYRFVEANASLKVGQEIKKGQAMATVSTAYGSEYKDGTHLHFEMQKDGVLVDPAAYLDIDYQEK